MDKNSRNKAVEGGSSDEEEDFESADEGEEGTKSVKPQSATSADIGSAHSTLKELVGKNETTSQVTSAEEIKTGTTGEAKQNIKMDGDTVQEEHKVETLAEDDSDRVGDKRSPSSEQSVQDSESGETEFVEGDTEKLNINTPKMPEDELKATKNACDTDEKGDTEAIREEIHVDQNQSPENETKRVTEENTVEEEDHGQKEASESSDKDQQKSTSESTCDDEDKDTPDR